MYNEFVPPPPKKKRAMAKIEKIEKEWAENFQIHLNQMIA